MAMALTQISFHGSNSKLRFNHLVIISTRHNSTRLPSTLNMKYNVKSKPLYLSDTSRTLFSFPFNNHGKLCMRLQSNVSSPATSISMPLELLNCWEDEYDGVVIDAHSLPSSTNAFVALLRASLSYWKLKGKNGIWLKILAEQADHVPVAITEGFCYHHAEPGFVMLTYWIPEGPCLLPASASHQVGIAGFVINDKSEVLVVKEKRCPCRCSGMWKLPTGFLNKSEELFSAVVREVEEETGIKTSFVEVTAFRHAHLMTFENSDLLFVCMLKPLSTEIKVDEDEIEAAMWMSLDEFLEQPFCQEDCMSKKVVDMCIARYENRSTGFTPHSLFSHLDGRPTYLYSVDNQ